jgi:tetratricopeptide (TPR) repeat protein
MERGATRAALDHLEQALDTVRRLPETRETAEQTIDIRFDMRNSLLPLGDRTRMGEQIHEAEVLARRIGDQRRLARTATFMVIQCLNTGDYPEAIRFGDEALSLARAQGDRAIEVVATSFVGITRAAMGDFGAAISLLERNVALEGDLRYERFGAPAIQWALCGAHLAVVNSELGRFEEAMAQAEAALALAETADQPFTLYWTLIGLGSVLLLRGELPSAARILERGLELSRSAPIAVAIPLFASTLAAAYALGGRADEALPLIAGPLAAARRGDLNRPPPPIFLCVATTYLAAGRLDEAAETAREAVALSGSIGARASLARALCLSGDIAAAAGAEDAEKCYREALALAGSLGMRPVAGQCHLGLGRFYWRMGKPREAVEHLTPAASMFREMGMRFWLDQAQAELQRTGS